MTTPTRVAEIAERHAKATKGEWTRVDGEGFTDFFPHLPDMMTVHHSTIVGTAADADFIEAAREDIPYLLARDAAAQARSREDAEIMREAADLIARTFPFTQANLITKLRARAHELEGRTDG